ncbi:MAG TPA: GAP family protein [Acidimicrobiales bacterium]|nr:GAP family protein [Acidimicrobiales bacterium]
MAVALAVNPLPIIALVLLLNTARARTNGVVFVLGWLSALGVVGGIMLVLADAAEANEGGSPAAWVSWTKLFLGLLLLVVAARQFLRRRGEDDEHEPAWMQRVETTTPSRSFGLAAALAGLNPKNLLLVAGGVSAIAETGISGPQQALAYSVFVLVASIGVFVPLLIHFTMGDRAPAVLGRLRDWMSNNSSLIIALICLLIGVKLLGDSIGALTG